MSFVRFGTDGSAVYIYDDTVEGLTCCGCILTDPWPAFGDDGHAAMLAHIAEHRAAGHRVPAWVDDALRADAHVQGVAGVEVTPGAAALLERRDAAATRWDIG